MVGQNTKLLHSDNNETSIDFETFSFAGYQWDGEKWRSVSKSPPHGLGAIGAAAYAEHQSTEVLTFAYGGRLWHPGLPLPLELFEHVKRGGIIRAWNSPFEYWIWNKVCVPKYGFPPLPYWQMRDTAANARHYGAPGKLKWGALALGVDEQKDASGTRLLNKFSKPRKPTKRDPKDRNYLADHPMDACDLHKYCLQDVNTETAIHKATPPLPPGELDVWLLDQEINIRGVHVNHEALRKLQHFVDEIRKLLNAELHIFTMGVVTDASKLQSMRTWLADRRVYMETMDKDAVKDALERPTIPPDARRVLEIRQMLGLSSVAKIDAIDRRITSDGRLHDLFAYYGAERTGRWAGRGPQPQNLPGNGPKCYRCRCGRIGTYRICPFCEAPHPDAKPKAWNRDCVRYVFSLKTFTELYRSFASPLDAVVGCLRALFSARPGYQLVCSDFSAIEAVVLAMLAGEQWRIDVFRTHGKIYEMSASKITGIPFEEMIAHKEHTGEHHWSRKKIGKIAELSSGYGGWIGAWKAFGADVHFDTDADIKKAILQWRADNPRIVEFWGGQVRKHPQRWEFQYEFYGLEGAAVRAVLSPGQRFKYRSISYIVQNDVLICSLPSGRNLYYHTPRLTPKTDNYSRMPIWQLSYMGYNTNYKVGPTGWIRLQTYGGKLTENTTQAVARDILANSMLNAREAGYPIVMHVHDEIAAEVLARFNRVSHFERIISIPPWWAANWPIRAAGGWQDDFFFKD